MIIVDDIENLDEAAPAGTTSAPPRLTAAHRASQSSRGSCAARPRRSENFRANIGAQPCVSHPTSTAPPALPAGLLFSGTGNQATSARLADFIQLFVIANAASFIPHRGDVRLF
jgi:hypothetical protein